MRFVFDSSSLISMGQTCLIEVLHALQHSTSSEFFIPESVFRETVSTPLRIKRFELNAVRIKKAVDGKWLNVEPADQGASDEIMRVANNCFSAKGRPVSILQRGECDALALVKKLGAGALVIDERTARMLIEAPMKLRELMESRYNEKIGAKIDNINALGGMFGGLAIVRSVDLVALAFEKGLFAEELEQNKLALEAALYATKYSGCAVSGVEIDRFLQNF